jgi:hypothetical protein
MMDMMDMYTLWCHQIWQLRIPYKWRFEAGKSSVNDMGRFPLPCLINEGYVGMPYHKAMGEKPMIKHR